MATRRKTVAATCEWCKREFQAQFNSVKLGMGRFCSKSCSASGTLTRHGHASSGRKSPTYISYRSMLTRCLNASNFKYPYYGGRGISICQRWLDSFENFLADMGERPDGTSIDRIDVNGNYEPGNCRWATPLQQADNQRHTLSIQYKGDEYSFASLTRLLGIPRYTLRARIMKGWDQSRWADPVKVTKPRKL